jgi:histidine triad (HIT) family protein
MTSGKGRSAEQGAAEALHRDCVFCRIASGEIPAQAVAQDDEFFAFNDLRPLAPVHVLVVPRRHLTSLDDIEQLGADGAGRLIAFVAATARAAGVAASGYRVVTNTGPDAGQEVMHLHWHIIGGAPLGGMV